MSVTKVEEVGLVWLGEGPHWDVSTKSLFYVDVFGTAIHRYTPSTGEHVSAKIDEKAVTLIVPVAGCLCKPGEPRKFLLGCDRYIKRVEWDCKSVTVTNMTTITEVDTSNNYKFNKINDGKCDPTGRLWFGTMGQEIEHGSFEREMGSLYSLEPKGAYKTHQTKVGISNGIAFSNDSCTMFYIDSYKATVDAFDIDLPSGTLSNRRAIFTLGKHGIPGVPDGMTIDKNDNLWVAIYDGSRVINIDPHKPETLLRSISIPAKQVTSVTFGGDNLDVLYVTTGRNKKEGEEELSDDHGALYKVTGLGVKGYAGVLAMLP